MGIDAKKYQDLVGGDDYDAMEVELKRIIGAKPTELHPYDREALLEAMIVGLEDRESAPWTEWPPHLYLTTLQAVKCLSRNPVGSTPLIAGLSTILHHTSLPLPPPASPFSHPPNSPEHATSLEALRMIANTCVLHTAGAKALARAGAGLAIAKALKDLDISNDRLFLLARLGFLASIADAKIVLPLVDKEGLVDSLVRHMSTTLVVPENYMTISDMLKFSNNVIRFYAQPEEWSDKLVPLLAPILAIFHSIPFNDLAPPLSHCINTLLSIPYTDDLQTIWSHVRPVTPPASSPPKKFEKLSSMLHGQPRRSFDSIKESMSLSPPGTNELARRRSPSPTRTDDTLAIPTRLMEVLGNFTQEYLRYPVQPDEVQKVNLDEILPPVLALLLKLVVASKEIRMFVKNQILPPTLDRSSEAGPLEKRSSILGALLRLMNGVKHTSSRDTACELLWAICGSDPASITNEIGYGNAAGLLFRKGLSGPPPAKIEEIQELPEERNPITSLAPPSVEPHNPLDDMTEEEKEREAEKLFVLFDRMEKNPVISMKAGDDDTKAKTPMEVMREKLERGHLEDDSRDDMRKKDQERKDEEEALADLKRYKERTAKK